MDIPAYRSFLNELKPQQRQDFLKCSMYTAQAQNGMVFYIQPAMQLNLYIALGDDEYLGACITLYNKDIYTNSLWTFLRTVTFLVENDVNTVLRKAGYFRHTDDGDYEVTRYFRMKDIQESLTHKLYYYVLKDQYDDIDPHLLRILNNDVPPLSRNDPNGIANIKLLSHVLLNEMAG